VAKLQYINFVKGGETRLRINGDLSRNLDGLGAEVMEMFPMFEQQPAKALWTTFWEYYLIAGFKGIFLVHSCL
jgi:hypothetical protein